MLAGGARDIWEFAHGESAVDGEAPVTPPNPQGLTGWEWSGPPWGSAPLHPLAWWSGRAAISTVEQPTVGGIYVGPNALVHFEWDVWIRPHDLLPAPHIAPYSRAVLAMRAVRRAGATTPTMTMKSMNLWPLEQSDDDGQTTTFTSPNGSETLFAFSNAYYVDVAPGHNLLRFEFSHAGAGVEVEILSMCLYNFAKASH